jgi:DNA (cytosine-5)-methyltransferase 1
LELKARFIPPYDPAKFPNKWRKMEPDKPARTLMAHLGKDSYSHIHYDSEQARTISVREAARLQSFPDGFRFSGTMNPAFRQIGNAVPPLLSVAIASSILAGLGVSVDNQPTPDALEQCELATASSGPRIVAKAF